MQKCVCNLSMNHPGYCFITLYHQSLMMKIFISLMTMNLFINDYFFSPQVQFGQCKLVKKVYMFHLKLFHLQFSSKLQYHVCQVIVSNWYNILLEILVNLGSSNDSVPDGTIPFHQPMLTCHEHDTDRHISMHLLWKLSWYQSHENDHIV